MPPGTRLLYSTGNTHLLSAILTQATGKSTLQFAREELGRPLGFHIADWPTDPKGIYFGGNNMEMTPRQMLAFGELYVNQGRANGRQVIPESWVETSLQRRVESSRERGRYYGYGWWLRDMASVNIAYAWGYGGQFILLAPELDLVVVTAGDSEANVVVNGQIDRTVSQQLELLIVGQILLERLDLQLIVFPGEVGRGVPVRGGLTN